MKVKQIINICYIDDRIDSILDRYLDEYCKNKNIDTESNYHLLFSDYTFESTDTYKTLLNNNIVNKANIIVIDSRLFENESSSLSKFTGEQFKIILRQILPFIKTIVISQNEPNPDSLTVKKYNATGRGESMSANDYYDQTLLNILNEYISATLEEFEVLNQLALDNEVDSLLVGTIQSTIAGIQDTALFEKQDLDKLIELFNEVKVKYEN